MFCLFMAMILILACIFLSRTCHSERSEESYNRVKIEILRYAQYDKQYFRSIAISLLYSLTFYYVGCIYAADTVYLLSYGGKRHK